MRRLAPTFPRLCSPWRAVPESKDCVALVERKIRVCRYKTRVYNAATTKPEAALKDSRIATKPNQKLLQKPDQVNDIICNGTGY